MKFKHLLPMVIVLLFVSFGATVMVAKKAQAVSGSCWFNPNTAGTCSVKDYGKYGVNDVLTGRDSSGGGQAIPSSIDSKAEFINFITDTKFAKGSLQDQVGAAFIMQTMLGKHTWPTSADIKQWKTDMNQGNVSFTIETHDVGKTSYYDPAKRNDFFGDHPVAQRRVVVIRQWQNGVNKTVARIEIGCGNMVDGVLVLVPPPKTCPPTCVCPPDCPPPAAKTPFTITVYADQPIITPDNEDPSDASFTSHLYEDPDGVSVEITREFYVKDNAGGVTPLSAPLVSTETTSKDFGPDNFSSIAKVPGYQVCNKITSKPGAGEFDSTTGLITKRGLDAVDEKCVPIVDKPYLKVFGGSAWAGSAFSSDSDPSCSNVTFGDGKIRTYARYKKSKLFGSSAQYAAMAIEAIEGNDTDRGFYSASQESRGPDYLSFANDTFDPANGDWGGNFSNGAGGRCVPDYFDKNNTGSRYSTTSPLRGTFSSGATIDLSADTYKDNFQYFGTGPVTIKSPGFFNKHITLYIDGNAGIISDIKYPAIYKDSDSIPYLTIIVHGKLVIDQGVNTLNGLFVAQRYPGELGSDLGVIDTCGDGNSQSVLPKNSLFTSCNGNSTGKPLNAKCNGGGPGDNTGVPLRIYGALVANKVYFNRTNGSLRCANPSNYANPELSSSDKIAELIYFSPEIVIGRPAFNFDGDSYLSIEAGAMESYVELPPIF